MTIRLLCAYGVYPTNAIVTFDAGTEAGLVAIKQATTTLTGGVAYVAPAVPNQSYPATVMFDGAGNFIGLVGPTGAIITLGGGVAAPGAPTGLVLTALAGAVSAAFNAPSGNGGSAVTRYDIMLSNGLTGSGLTSPIVINTPNGTAVTATAKAVNVVGSSAASAPSNSVTPLAAATAPGAPTGLTLSPLTAAISVAYAAPVNNGGSPILDYEWTDINGAKTTLTSNPQTLAYPAGTAITGTLKARNSVGLGPASAQAAPVTPTTATAPPLAIAGQKILTAAILPFTSTNAATTTAFTAHLLRTLEAPWKRIRFGLVNGGPTAYVVKAAVCFPTACDVNGAAGQATDLNSGSTVPWYDLTTGGVDGIALPAGLVNGGSANADWGIGWADWVEHPSVARTDIVGARPLVAFRVEYPVGSPSTMCQLVPSNSTGGAAPYSWNVQDFTGENDGRIMRNRYQQVLGVTNKAAMTAAASNDTRATPSLIIQYELVDGTKGITVAAFDDSTGAASNQSDRPPQGMYFQARNLVSTQSRPVEIAQYSGSGMSTAQWAQRARVLAPLHAGDKAIVSSNSINGLGPTPYNLASWQTGKAGVALVKQYLTASGIGQIITRTMMPTRPDGLYRSGASDNTYRRADNAALVAAATRDSPVIDIGSASEGPTADASGQWSLLDELYETLDVNATTGAGIWAHPNHLHGVRMAPLITPHLNFL